MNIALMKKITRRRVSPTIIQFIQQGVDSVTANILTEVDYNGLTVNSAELSLFEATNSPQSIVDGVDNTIFTGLINNNVYNVVLTIDYVDELGNDKQLQQQITATTNTSISILQFGSQSGLTR